MSNACSCRAFLFAAVLAPSILAFVGTLSAQDDDLVVRTAIDPSETVFVGGRVQWNIDVLARDVWANLPGIGHVDVPGAIVVAPPSSSIRLSEQIDGDTFSGQRYQWWIYPQRQGRLEIPSQTLSVQLKPLGLGEPTTRSAATESLAVEVTYPEGVPVGTNVICASEYSATQTWEPDAGQFRVGDGITRTIQRTIDGTPAMILSPIQPAPVAGAQSYVKQPEVSDRFTRGALTGRRTDSVTYVFTRSGEVELPSIRLQYWNLDVGKLETIELEGIQLKIDPDIAAENQSPIPESTLPASAGRLALTVIAVLIAAIAIVVRYRLAIVRRVRHLRTTIEASESVHFHRFLRVAKTNDPLKTLQSLIHWLDVAHPNDPAPRLDLFLDEHADKEAAAQLSQLQVAVDAKSASWDTRELTVCIRQARQHWRAQRRKRVSTSANPLPPLRGLS